MTPTTLTPLGQRAIEKVLREHTWLDPRRDDGMQRFVAVLVDALGPIPAGAELLHQRLPAAFAAARATLPMVSLETCEAWFCAALVLATRQLAVESLTAPGPEEAQALLDAAVVLGESNASFLRKEERAYKLSALERACNLARKSLGERRKYALVGHVGREFAVACADQTGQSLTLFMTRGTSLEAVIRGVLLRADTTARRARNSLWSAGTREVLRPQAIAALADAAASIALAVPEHLAVGGTDAGEGALWLARIAARFAQCLSSVEVWLPQLRSPGALPVAFGAPGWTPPGVLPAPPAEPESVVPQELSRQETRTVMSTNPSETAMKDPTQNLLKTLQSDATDAAWRTAGSQFVKLARDPLVGLLSRHLAPGDESMRARIASFLETPIGTAMLSAILSAGLAALPPNAGGDIPAKLSRELRVRAMSDTGDLVADVLMGPLRQVVSLYLQDVQTGQAPAAPAALTDNNGQVTVGAFARAGVAVGDDLDR